MKRSDSLPNPSRFAVAAFLAFLALPRGASAAARPAGEMAAEVLKHIGSPRGICVVLGEEGRDLALELARTSELLIYLQMEDAGAVESARRAVEAAGLYGSRISIDRGPPSRIPLASGLADALVAAGGGAKVSDGEALRVLRPRGKAWIGEKEVVKPPAEGTEDWSHPYHGPDNNPVSGDRVARGPYLTQFLADPRYAPLPQVAVASAGRVFKLFGHIAFKEREEPWLNTLAAFNGHNGAFLWRLEVPAGIMVHRSTLIATPEVVYYADDRSCKVIDAATGRKVDEIAPPADVAGGTFWKWMALEDGVLYALIGADEQRDPVMKAKSENHGWPWDPLSPGFNQPRNAWGFARSVLAIEAKSKKVLWSHSEKEEIDGRATCLKDGKLFVFRHGSYLAALSAKTGRELWRRTKENAADLFDALGSDLNRQDWRTNWRTTAYLKAGDKALYFAGPMIAHLVAVSAEDGYVLWKHPYSNYQIVLQGDALYGLSGQIDSEVSRKFDPLTGKVLEEFQLGRRACTRPTGSIDAIFCRAGEGSTRLDLETSKPQLVSPMRAQCQDGVTIANGLLYWWPSVCDCNLSLYGITCLGPAGEFDFEGPAREAERLETAPGDAAVQDLPESPADWPAFRADSAASATSAASVPAKGRLLWAHRLPGGMTPTAPTAAGGLALVSGSDGAVRALDAPTGKLLWTSFTAGAVRFPPSVWKGRALVGSGDGWAYAFEARTGRLLWRFRAAPAERRIPVYGQLLSTWPASSGVLVKDGTAYVAAGIVNFDGTHVVALDAATGRLKWQNNSSGHMDKERRSGVSVQGHMIVQGGKLCLAGGNVVSPALYDLADGKCLSDPGLAHRLVNNNIPAAESPRGAELFLIGDQVMVGGQPFYAHPRYKVYDPSVLYKTWVGTAGDRDYAWINNARVMALPRGEDRTRKLLASFGRPRAQGLEPIWSADLKDSVAVALARNALVVATTKELVVLDLGDGHRLWAEPLPAAAVNWGLALDRDGRAIVTLEDGQVVCFGEK